MIFCNHSVGYKKLNLITSIHSPNRGVPEYPQKYASILHAQKLYLACPAKSTGRSYLVLAQFDLADSCFYSR